MATSLEKPRGGWALPGYFCPRHAYRVSIRMTKLEYGISEMRDTPIVEGTSSEFG